MDRIGLLSSQEGEACIILAVDSAEAGHLLEIIRSGLLSYDPGHDCWETGTALALFLSDQVPRPSDQENNAANAA